jgi:hypothetical protein
MATVRPCASPGQAMPRPSGAPSPASSSPRPPSCATWPPEPTSGPSRPATPGSPRSPWTIRRSRPSPSGASGPSSRRPSTLGWPPIPSATRTPRPGHLHAPVPARRAGQADALDRVAAAEAGHHAGVWTTTTSGPRCSWPRCCSWPGLAAPSSCIPSAARCSLIGVGSLLLVLATLLVLQQPGLRADRHLGRGLVRANLVAALRRRAPNARREPSR